MSDITEIFTKTLKFINKNEMYHYFEILDNYDDLIELKNKYSDHIFPIFKGMGNVKYILRIKPRYLENIVIYKDEVYKYSFKLKEYNMGSMKGFYVCYISKNDT